MTRHASPILTTLLDTDAYKLHMQQAVFHRYYDVTVAAEFRCRGDDMLGIYADEINEQIASMASLVLSDDEFAYLSGLPFFKADYLSWLRTFRYDPRQVSVRNHHGKLDIRISGPWREVIMWEVPLLALISEVVHRHRSPLVTPQMAVDKLKSKLVQFADLTADLDMSRFRLMDFGTRRRFSHDVQLAIVSTLKQDFPWLVGSSNYEVARQLGIAPVGTQAHEWFQAHQQISPVLANSQRAALQAWLEEYPDQLGIALTDCITMDAFLRDFGRGFATAYQGLRHDSGDPFEWGEKAIAHYQQLELDPQSKTLVFSDNLDLDKAVALYRQFGQRINVIFGIGTRLTCDIPEVKPLNIVIKLVECNGKPVAKLSDSPGKTICQDKAFVRALRKAFDLPLVKKAS
ncbi:nicotinate phosphoribosyltransferase [bacteria symbiont BFo1 of Frankliniella occidentalis]|uniref:nicotinate phosphoribosyltransferase n=1 Tax=Erwinia TaxID=551 RepID=UPI00066450B8|nr:MULTISPECIES: nicotinate phosphoribosyltransferase [Erwinia]KMV69941.1 nicotinate phosphoribosyltransferase [bacteria symbiont BFo1 of Frankliniella occidentalis]VTT35110.1 nicotinate phosphoribosyltransferase [Klebsiella pneumoniae]KYP84266.1 nicotinate phosphoribosyltransferase [bacteria symbiont BFo1 of Frankliniella occidentalis]KYP89576.1 nicotinate phosphoribosyltransferase [bacteria symbiont BFo1 of Frankliniella occidentalis]MBN1085261.1 nicotinate phosphoribosyltransferase [Erwinia